MNFTPEDFELLRETMKNNKLLEKLPDQQLQKLYLLVCYVQKLGYVPYHTKVSTLSESSNSSNQRKE